jgi:hypothetical protein
VAQGSFTHAVNFWVNLATGAAGTLKVAVGTPTSLSAQVTPFGNSWYRVSITASYPATDSLTLTVISATADNSVTRVVGSSYDVWGAQLEAGAFPTSYIPTTTDALTRSEDVCSITGSDFSGFYNASEGSTIVQAAHPVPSAVSVMLAYDNDTNSATARNYLQVGPGPRTLQYIISNTTANIISNNVKDTLQHKHSGAYKLDDIVAVFDGAVIGGDSSCVPTAVTKLTIGNQGAGAAALNGHIGSLRYYKKRLTNFKLQSLTS